MTITVGTATASAFVQVGVVEEIDETHYYDPRGDEFVEHVAPTVTGSDEEWVVLEGGTRFRLVPCQGIEDCAVLDVDASKHERAVQLRVALPHVAGQPVFGTGDAAASANVAGHVREMQLRVDMKSESSL